jgi:hypothetical protein
MMIHLIVSCELQRNELILVPRTGSLHLIIIRTSFVALIISNKRAVLNNLNLFSSLKALCGQLSSVMTPLRRHTSQKKPTLL